MALKSLSTRNRSVIVVLNIWFRRPRMLYHETHEKLTKSRYLTYNQIVYVSFPAWDSSGGEGIRRVNT